MANFTREVGRMLSGPKLTEALNNVEQLIRGSLVLARQPDKLYRATCGLQRLNVGC